MSFRNLTRSVFAAWLCALILPGQGGHVTNADTGSTPSMDTDAQFEAVLAAMKHPPATGILVTEIGPESAAGSAGLQAGDIIYHYAGTEVHDLQTLRQAVAEVFASHVAGDNDNKVLLAVHRGAGGGNVILQIPRAPLGIRAIEVDAGVPLAPNPPASPRGSIRLEWDDLIKQQISATGDSSFFRINEGDASTPWIGWQHRMLQVGDGAILGEADTYHVDPDDPSAKIASSESVQFRLRTGDYANSPAFVLESVDVTMNNGDGSTTTIAGERAGAMLRTQTKVAAPTRILGPVQHETACPLSAIVPPAIPILAGAMPHETGAALALSVLSIRDGIARPGYLLMTRGSQSLRGEKSSPTAWRVDLLHCGVIADTYWFNDQRRLLEIDTPSGTTVVTRRVNSQEEASVPVKAKEAKD